MDLEEMRREKEEANKEARVSIFSLVGVYCLYTVYHSFSQNVNISAAPQKKSSGFMALKQLFLYFK